jgi:ribosomal protein L37AE/L43A
MLRRLVNGSRSVIAAIEAKFSKTVKPKRKRLFFDVHVCDHCNLNCKGCSNFSPLAEKKFVDLSILERDFKRLSELTNRMCDVSLIGGEPLLHPDITKIFDTVRKYFDGGAQMVTNGILLASRPDEFWQNLRKNAIKIVISIYPINIDEEKIIAQARKHRVELNAIDRTKETSWTKHAYDFSGGQNIEKAFRACPWGNVCVYLEDGKLDPCGFPLLVRHFNRYFDNREYKFAAPTEEDYVDIFKVNSLDEILEKIANPIPYCRYCTLKFSHPKWEPSSVEIGEWVSISAMGMY